MLLRFNPIESEHVLGILMSPVEAQSNGQVDDDACLGIQSNLGGLGLVGLVDLPG